MIEFVPTELDGVVIVEPQVHRDPRGFFFESYHQQKYREGGIDATFVQDNHSRSIKGVLRGLHAQNPRPQGKLVRVLEGEIFDVAVDIRRGSPTFARWVSTLLSSENFRQIYIPPGYAHGFCVLSDSAQIEYKCTDFYSPADELTIVWNDPQVAIAWPLEGPVLSDKDRQAPRLEELLERLPAYDESGR